MKGNSPRAGTRDRWVRAVLADTRIGDACKVVLVAFATHMSDAGYVSVPRDVIAAMVGKHPSRVTESVTVARRVGLLDQVGGGYRGRTAEYVAVLPGRKVTGRRSPNPANGDGPAVSIFSHLSAGKGDRPAVTQYARAVLTQRHHKCAVLGRAS